MNKHKTSLSIFKLINKMAENTVQLGKKCARRGIRYQMELKFDNEEGKQALLSRIESARRYLAPEGSAPLDNGQLLLLLLDKVDMEAASASRSSERLIDHADKQLVPMLENSGLCVINRKMWMNWSAIAINIIIFQEYLLAMVVVTFRSLLTGLNKLCRCQSYSRTLTKEMQVYTRPSLQVGPHIFVSKL